MPTKGHINPTLPVIKELVKQGHKIFFFATPEYKNVVESAGCTFKKYNFPDLDLRLVRNTVLITEKAVKLTKESILPMEKEIKALNPDCIIHDSISLVGKIIASRLKLPAVSCITTFVISKRVILRYSKAFHLSFYLMIKHGKTTLKTIREYNSLMKENGLKTSGIEDVFLNKENLNIVFTSKFFQPLGDAFGGTFHFVGTSIYDRREGEINLGKDKKIIYISLGTIHNDDLKFYKSCVEAFKDSNFTVVMSIGHRFSHEDLKNIPNNFIVKNYIPQLEVLKKASVFISHGGMNSVNESLYFGVPLIVIPQTDEQKLNGIRVKELGGGFLLSKTKITKNLIFKAVTKVMVNKKFSENAKKIGNSFKTSGGYERAASLIDEYIKHKMV
jgi:MGT family glycosyltransferase